MREIHVGNVPYAATEEDLKGFLESITSSGAVCSCELKRDSFQTRHKGYGFVTFSDEEHARLVSTWPYPLTFQGRSLRINVSKRQVQHNPVHNVMRLEMNALSIGCLSGDDTLHVLWSTSQSVEAEFDFRNRKFDVKVTVDSEIGSDGLGICFLQPLSTTFKLEFQFKYIYCCYNARTTSSRGPKLLFELWWPPHIFHKSNSIDDLLFEMNLMSTPPKQPWVRTTDFTEDRSIGQSFAYLLDFPASFPAADIAKVVSCLEDYRLVSENTRQLRLREGTSYSDTSPEVLVPLLKCPDRFPCSFRVMFLVNKLVQVGNLSGPSLSTDFFQLLYQTPEESALWVLERLGDTEKTVTNSEQWLRGELRNIQMRGVRLPSSTSIQLEDGLIWVYRVMVSPTKIYCVGREPEVSNRVTRQYIDMIESFIRVSFVEEDYSSLGSQALSGREGLNSDTDVYRRIIKVLTQGFWLNGRHFEFLALSSSQLREQSVWMFAETDDVSVNSIRNWMGNFLDIRNVAKCAARMGQCFSSTTKTLTVESWEVDIINDVKTADGKYCFSDGIGKISHSLARRVAAKCGCRGVPSAFQIRYSGFKGVVAVCHESLHKLSLRDSMKKFDADHFDLEVISWSKRLPCYLNREIITLLSTLGIRDNVFEQLQNLVLSKLNEVVDNVAVALDILQMTSSGATHQMTMEMLKARYHPRTEPFLRSLVQAFRAFQLLQLRTKSRILVPKGRTMMGCLDETGILDYGEVFLRVSSFPGTQNFIDDGLRYEDDGLCVVEGPVVVAKNPCLHPGDVRVLKAVDAPELYHMVDCVVFPQRGCRPHTNECSGSDLDGDLYFVTWDELLIPLLPDDPMDYDAPEIIRLPRPVTIGDIQNFFGEYMKSDTLGLIAHAHVVHADKSPDMARDPKCLELARLYTVVVDFPKTGKTAVMDPSLRPESYPDFMEKEDKVSYESQSVIGILFRAVLGAVRQTTLMSAITRITRDDIVRSFDPELIWPGFEIYIEEATMLKSWYDAKLVGLMNQYEIKTEAEAVSGNILPLSKFYVRRQGEVKDRISSAVKSLQSEARSWFKHGSEGTYHLRSAESTAPLLEEREAFGKASAWYHVTYHRQYLTATESGTGARHQYLLSFPWVVHDTLLNVKRRNRRES